MQAAGLADKDLLDVRYEGEVPHVLPYFIAVDEATRTLVLAIRGAVRLAQASNIKLLAATFAVFAPLVFVLNCATCLQEPDQVEISSAEPACFQPHRTAPLAGAVPLLKSHPG
jgi:hypothetical protein